VPKKSTKTTINESKTSTDFKKKLIFKY